MSAKGRVPVEPMKLLSLPKLANGPLPNFSNEILERIARAASPELALASAPVHKVIRGMCDVLDILDGRPVRPLSAEEYQRVLTAAKVFTVGAFEAPL